MKLDIVTRSEFDKAVEKAVREALATQLEALSKLFKARYAIPPQNINGSTLVHKLPIPTNVKRGLRMRFGEGMTVEDLSNTSIDDLLKLRNVGPKGLRTTRDLLNLEGFFPGWQRLGPKV